jgi:hypothetical protein
MSARSQYGLQRTCKRNTPLIHHLHIQPCHLYLVECIQRFFIESHCEPSLTNWKQYSLRHLRCASALPEPRLPNLAFKGHAPQYVRDLHSFSKIHFTLMISMLADRAFTGHDPGYVRDLYSFSMVHSTLMLPRLTNLASKGHTPEHVRDEYRFSKRHFTYILSQDFGNKR